MKAVTSPHVSLLRLQSATSLHACKERACKCSVSTCQCCHMLKTCIFQVIFQVLGIASFKALNDEIAGRHLVVTDPVLAVPILLFSCPLQSAPS